MFAEVSGVYRICTSIRTKCAYSTRGRTWKRAVINTFYTAGHRLINEVNGSQSIIVRMCFHNNNENADGCTTN